MREIRLYRDLRAHRLDWTFLTQSGESGVASKPRAPRAPKRIAKSINGRSGRA
jgi:hypothetical protein